VFSQLVNRAVKRFDRTIGSRKHHATFHHCEHIGCQCIQIHLFGQLPLHGSQALTNCLNPSFKVSRYQRMRRRVLRVNLQRQATQRTSVGAIRCQYSASVAVHNREDPTQWLLHLCERRIHDHWAKENEVLFEHGAEQALLTVEKVIEAARIDLGVG